VQKFRQQHTIRLVFMPLFVLIMVVVNMRLGVFGGDLTSTQLTAFGVSLASLKQGEWFRLISGSFISHDVDMFVRQFLFAAIAIGWYEWHQGTTRAVLMFFFLDILGTLTLMFGIILTLELLELDGFSGLSATFDVGMSAGGFGLIGASIFHLQRARWILTLGMIALVVKSLLFPEIIADIAHLLMLPAGFLVERIRLQMGGAQQANLG